MLAFSLGRCKTRVKSFVAYVHQHTQSISQSQLQALEDLPRTYIKHDERCFTPRMFFSLIPMHLFVMLDCIVYVHIEYVVPLLLSVENTGVLSGPRPCGAKKRAAFSCDGDGVGALVGWTPKRRNRTWPSRNGTSTTTPTFGSKLGVGATHSMHYIQYCVMSLFSPTLLLLPLLSPGSSREMGPHLPSSLFPSFPLGHLPLRTPSAHGIM